MDGWRVRELADRAQFGPKEPARGSRGMVVASHPIATQVGIDVLRAGGNACDAALATCIAQTVVEPHMTTITGIMCFLYYDVASGKTTYMNGDMNAPLAPLTAFTVADAANGRAVGVPGWWAGFESVLGRHGTKSKEDLMAPAISLARDGFPIHPFLFGEIFDRSARIGITPQGREIFMPHGSILGPGATLRQERAARTLERLRDEGNEYFYRGDFSRQFVDTVQSAGGVLTLEDMDRYEVRWDEPAWGTYRGYQVAGSPPPDNGGTHIIEALNMFELLDLATMGPPTESPDTLYYMARIAGLVQEEGSRHPDPISHDFPLETILSKEYARVRLQLMEMDKQRSAPIAATVPLGTNHVTVVDVHGNAASVLHSCASLPWSNGLFCEGVSICAGGVHFLRHMPGPGERATGYVAPNIIFKNGKPILPSGSPSLSLIPNILQNVVNVLDFGMSIEESVVRPRFGGKTQGPGPLIEADLDESVRRGAEERGLTFEVVNPWNFHMGAFEGIYIDPGTGEASACADPRRAGMALAVWRSTVNRHITSARTYAFHSSTTSVDPA